MNPRKSRARKVRARKRLRAYRLSLRRLSENMARVQAIIGLLIPPNVSYLDDI